MTTDRFPPHDIDSEEAVIGSLLIDGEMIRGLTLVPDDFYHEQNKWLYMACLNLKEKGTAINQITLAQKLDEQGKLEACGGAAYLSHLISILPTSLDCLHYAEIVKRLASSRKLILAGEAISKMGYEANADTTEAIAKADKLLLDIRKTAGGSHIITPEDMSSMLMERYSGLYQQEKSIAFATGLTDLDRLLGGGFFPEEYIILGARPSIGKTTMARFIANYIGQNHNVLFCSAEMGITGLGDRDVAGHLGIPIDYIRQGNFSEETYTRIINEAIPKIDNQHIYHLPPEITITTSSIYQAAYEIKERHGLSFIVMDYIGLLADRPSENENQRLTHMSRSLKQMSMTLQVPLLCVAQLNRKVEERENKRPGLHDIRDSGSLEQDADVVLFMYREDYYYKTEEAWFDKYPQGNRYYKTYPSGIVEVMTAKKRQGPSGNAVRVLWDEKHQTYRNLARGDGK